VLRRQRLPGPLHHQPGHQHRLVGHGPGRRPASRAPAPPRVSCHGNIGACRGETTDCYGECDGIISDDPTINPDFAAWNHVFIGYCDGGSFTGSRNTSVLVNGKPIYYSGRFILAAVLEDLLLRNGCNACPWRDAHAPLHSWGTRCAFC
jgi:hypothetical protein